MSSSDDDDRPTLAESSFTRYSKFSVFVVLEPFSLCCNCLFVFYLISDRHLRWIIHHHVILTLLIVSLLTNLVEIPRILHFLRKGSVSPPTSFNCLIWQWCDYLLYGLANCLMLWASIERHLLVFHGHLMSTARGRFLFHYAPLLLIIVYVSVFYIVVIFVHPCEKHFHFDAPLCGSPCFTKDSIISLFDLFVHSWLPTFCIAILSASLAVRVINRRRAALGKDVSWRKHRRMIVQLLSISGLYLICLGPYTLVQVYDLLFGLSETADYIKNVYLFYVYWLLTLLLPYACIGCLPEVTNKLKRQVRNWLNQTNAVTPMSQVRVELQPRPPSDV